MLGSLFLGIELLGGDSVESGGTTPPVVPPPDTNDNQMLGSTGIGWGMLGGQGTSGTVTPPTDPPTFTNYLAFQAFVGVALLRSFGFTVAVHTDTVVVRPPVDAPERVRPATTFYT